MKRFSPILLVLILFSCTPKDPILGTWERYGDIYKGMRLRITQNSSSINAEIVKPADSGTLFIIGDIKWRDIRKVDDIKYEYRDLKKYPVELGSLFQNGYADSYLTLENDTIRTRLFSKGDEFVGTEQRWRRIKE